MKLIGKLDDMLVYEVERGKYIIVDPETGRWTVEWTWFGQLGRTCDTFTKLSEDADDEKGLEVIETNKSAILERLNDLEKSDDDIGQEYLKEQDEFYDSLEENREYDSYYGKYSDES